MSPAILAMTDKQRTNLARDSRKMIRTAWPHRHTNRAKLVIGANVKMLRDLATL